MTSGPTSPPSRRRGETLGAIGGALVGGAVSSLVYVLMNPVLERSSGLLRETQGLLWSAIPVCTVLGAVLGRAVVRRRSKHP
ncbi:MAG: hypothetical protein ACYC1I_11880 [Acidimicrobiales bacterium]